MQLSTFTRPLLWLGIALLGGLGQAFASNNGTLELMQVNACRATSSLLLYRGEGFQKEHAQRMEEDLNALTRALSALPEQPQALRASHQELVTQLRRGVSFGHSEDDMPWRYPEELAGALRGFLTATRSQYVDGTPPEAAIKVEYLAVQYLSRAYLGNFEIAREQPDNYLGQDERALLPAIESELAELDTKSNPAVAKLKTRWHFLKNALGDMNSQSNALVSSSGRPFAPMVVDRHARSLTNQWLSLQPVLANNGY